MRKKSEENPPKRVSAREPEVPDLTRTEAAWAKHEGEIRAMAPEGVRDARLDVTVAAAIAIAGVRNVLGQREALEAHFRDPPIEALERVEALALAAQHADLLHRVAVDPLARYADLLPRANELRGLLLHDLGMQVRRKRAEASVEEAIRAGDNSVRDKANDLNDLAHWYRKNWSTVSGKTTVEEGEITEAGALAVTLLARLGTAIAAPTPTEGELSSTELRRRAFTLLEDAYALVQRYGGFLFFDLPDGPEAYVPSLWSGRASGGAAKPESLPEPAPTTPAKPA